MDEKKILHSLAMSCSRKEMCLADVDEKLKKTDLADDAKARIKNYLISEKYVDDRRFAEFYVKDKARFNGWGEKKIRYMLSMKRINRDIIDEAMQSLNREIFHENIIQILRNKNQSLKYDDIQKRRAALMRLAASRGYNFDEAKVAIEAVLGHRDEADED